MNTCPVEPIVLFTPYFAARTPERQLELDTCLRQNIACPAIKRIFLLIDDGHTPPLTASKVEIIRIKARPTYRQWIELSIELTGSGISVLANSDIYFDETLGKIRDILREPNSFIALSRRDQIGKEYVPHPNPHWSQDAWALNISFDVPDSLKKYLELPLGVPRCDNKVAYSFAIHGWKIFNPFHFVRGVHVHETQQRNYDKKADLTVIGGVAYVHPSKSLEESSAIEIDVWAQNADAIRTVKLNKSLDRWANEKSGAENKSGNPLPIMTKPSVPAAGPKGSTYIGPGKPVSVAERHDFITQGKMVFDHLSRFQVYKRGDELLCLDWLQAESSRKAPVGLPLPGPGTGSSAGDALLHFFIPPVTRTSPIEIGMRPRHSRDNHFWQYPSATEKQAYENHLDIPLGGNFDTQRKVIHTYLGLPWATYIDRQTFPGDVPVFLRPRILGYRNLARAHGYELAVHTVCQQIHWKRLVKLFHEIGITDLHLSHCEKSIDPQRDGYRFRVHSWPLMATNFEDHARSDGLRADKLISEKRYLASFIGAHMSHYRSDVRPRLVKAAKVDGGDDLLVELNGEWHFNKIVYQEQVENKPLSQEELLKHDTATYRYNQILSDSIFSICPEGSGPNTLRLWESLAVGAIPVVIADEWIPPQIEMDGQGLEAACIFVTKSEINRLFKKLRTIDRATLQSKRAMCLQAYRQARALQTYHVSTGNRIAKLQEKQS